MVSESLISLMKRKYLAWLLAGLFSCASVLANDSSIGDDNGTIVFKQQADISMDKEVLQISPHKVQVDYVFTNTGKNDLTVRIAFPMPAQIYDPGDRGRVTDFKLWIDGVAGQTERKLLVLLEDKTDITEKVTRLGWSERDLKALLKGSDPPKGKKPLPREWFDGQPLFTLNEYFIWQQKFPAGRPVSIRHSYRPSLSSGIPLDAGSLIEAYGQSACMDENAKTWARNNERDTGLRWSHLRYILLTANNWQGPIKEFTLRIQKQLPTDLVSTCFEGELKKIDALTFEYRQNNYRPQSDLSVLFLQREPNRVHKAQ